MIKLYDTTLFREKERKDSEITIKLTKSQKERIEQMSKRIGLSSTKFIIGLIGAEHERQINESVSNVFNDDMPF